MVAARKNQMPPRWYVVRVRTNCEHKAAAYLQHDLYDEIKETDPLTGLTEVIGHEKVEVKTFLPIQKQLHNWSDRKKVVDCCVLPSMVFVYFRPGQREINAIRHSVYVSDFVNLVGTNIPAPIPTHEMETFRMMLESSEQVVSFHRASEVKAGDKVVVMSGPLKGRTGTLLRDASDDDPQLCVSLSVLGFVGTRIPKDSCRLVRDINHDLLETRSRLTKSLRVRWRCLPGDITALSDTELLHLADTYATLNQLIAAHKRLISILCDDDTGACGDMLRAISSETKRRGMAGTLAEVPDMASVPSWLEEYSSGLWLQLPVQECVRRIHVMSRWAKTVSRKASRPFVKLFDSEARRLIPQAATTDLLTLFFVMKELHGTALSTVRPFRALETRVATLDSDTTATHCLHALVAATQLDATYFFE